MSKRLIRYTAMAFIALCLSGIGGCMMVDGLGREISNTAQWTKFHMDNGWADPRMKED